MSLTRSCAISHNVTNGSVLEDGVRRHAGVCRSFRAGRSWLSLNQFADAVWCLAAREPLRDATLHFIFKQLTTTPSSTYHTASNIARPGSSLARSTAGLFLTAGQLLPSQAGNAMFVMSTTTACQTGLTAGGLRRGHWPSANQTRRCVYLLS